MIKFTLITVTYNAEATLERTLRSVAEQTYRRTGGRRSASPRKYSIYVARGT